MAFVDPARLYPLLFSPIYMTRVWGGSLLAEVAGRELPETNMPIGESWEIADRPDAQSIVRNGALAGHTLEQLVKHYGRIMLGNRWNGTGRFPLLIKLIDAGERLSLQVHPDEAYCSRHRENCEPKTEMWYIMANRAGARVMAGLSPRATRQQVVSYVGSAEIENYLQTYASNPGDAFFIPAGTLHSIGEGNLVLEVQQNSDTTFRLSDWGRVDAAGHSRELHMEQGFEAIDFMNRTTSRIPGVVGEAAHNRKFALVNRCRSFSVDVLKLRNMWRDDTNNGGSFHLLTAVNSPVKVGRHSETDAMVEVKPGETVLMPACIDSYFILPQRSGSTEVIRTTL